MAVGRAAGVTVTLPVIPVESAAQLASLRVATAYVVVVVGVMLADIGLVDPLNAVPLDNVPLQGPVPVTAIDRVDGTPAHATDEPVILAVGLVRIVTDAVVEKVIQPSVDKIEYVTV